MQVERKYFEYRGWTIYVDYDAHRRIWIGQSVLPLWIRYMKQHEYTFNGDELSISGFPSYVSREAAMRHVFGVIDRFYERFEIFFIREHR